MPAYKLTAEHRMGAPRHTAHVAARDGRHALDMGQRLFGRPRYLMAELIEETEVRLSGLASPSGSDTAGRSQTRAPVANERDGRERPAFPLREQLAREKSAAVEDSAPPAVVSTAAGLPLTSSDPTRCRGCGCELNARKRCGAFDAVMGWAWCESCAGAVR